MNHPILAPLLVLSALLPLPPTATTQLGPGAASACAGVPAIENQRTPAFEPRPEKMCELGDGRNAERTAHGQATTGPLEVTLELYFGASMLKPTKNVFL